MATLRRGSTGPEVARLQQRLTELGFDPNGIDGRFGPGTEAAVKAFQQANGLTVDGIVGPITRAALQLDAHGPQTAEKVLWVVGYNSLTQFINRAVAANVTAVAVRTDNNMPQAITAAHNANLKIYGWRWPSAKPGPAMAESDRAVMFLNQGMDGYFVDPEGSEHSDNWDQNGLEQLARDFCTRVKQTAGARPLGVTSHYRAREIFTRLPWEAFFEHADVLLPQAYWRSDGGTIGSGDPAQNYQRSIQAWMDAGGDQAKIVPMAGELRRVTGVEITEHVGAAQNAGIPTLHFYTDEPGISSGVWDAIRQA
jgi:hypothetical protein